MKPKPLDLEEIKREWKKRERLHEHRVFYLTAKGRPATINKLELEEEKLYLVKQRLKSACEFYLRYKSNPQRFLEDNPEYKTELIENCSALTHLITGGNVVRTISEDDYSILVVKEKYNEWLFKLAFKGILGDEHST